MLGYVLVSGKNELVFVDGCEQFMSKLNKIVDRQFNRLSFDADRASSSSGVYTDFSKKKSTTKRAKKRLIARNRNLNEISHILLPIINFYRAASISENDQIESISSNFGKIQFKQLESGQSIISFASRNENPSAMISYVEENIAKYFGPLVNICHMDLLAIKSAKDCMQNLYQKYQQRKFRGYLNVRENCKMKDELAPLGQVVRNVSSACERLSGNNKTLLCVNRNIHLTSSSSKLNENVKVLSPNELNTYIELLPVPQSLFTVTTSQLWMQVRKGSVPYFVNFSQYRISDKITFVVMNESTDNVLIRYMTFLLRQIKHRQEEPTKSEIREITKTILEASKLIANKIPIDDEMNIAFMKNPTRTAIFLQTIWTQAKETLTVSETTSSPDWSLRASRLSVSSFKSAISFLSLTSAQPSRVSSDRSSIKKFDILMGYLERQTVTIIQELCLLSKRSSEKTFASTVQIVLDDYIKLKQGPQLASFDSALSHNYVQQNLLPSSLRLDMLAYKLTISGLGYSIAFIPENLRTDLSRFSAQRASQDFCATITGKSKTMYTFYFIRNSTVIAKKVFNYSFTLIYPHFANNQLAMNQIQKLFDILMSNVLSMSKLYQ